MSAYRAWKALQNSGSSDQHGAGILHALWLQAAVPWACGCYYQVANAPSSSAANRCSLYMCWNLLAIWTALVVLSYTR